VHIGIMLLDMEGTSFIFKEEVFLDDYDSTIFFLSLQARVLTVYNIAITRQLFKIPKNSSQADRVVVL
jgi:hypothetical protein